MEEMIRRGTVRLGVTLITIGMMMPAGAEESGIGFEATGYLVKGPDAVLFVREPVAITGMFPVSGTAYRLSPDAAERFEPFVVEQADGSAFKWVPAGMPREPREGDPVPLLTISAKLNLVKPDEDSRRMRPDISSIYEVSSIDIISAEFIGVEWYSEFQSLDRTLNDLLNATLEAPGTEKEDRVGGLLEQGSRILHELMDPPVRDEWRKLVHGFSPDATMETRDQRKRAADRGRILRICAQRLGIEPETPFPPGIDENGLSRDEFRPDAGSFAIERAGLTVRPLNQKELAEYIALEGFAVVDAAGNITGFEFETGDVVLSRPYLQDLTRGRGRGDPEAAQRHFRWRAESLARGREYGGEGLRVIRKGKPVSLPFPENTR